MALADVFRPEAPKFKRTQVEGLPAYADTPLGDPLAGQRDDGTLHISDAQKQKFRDQTYLNQRDARGLSDLFLGMVDVPGMVANAGIRDVASLFGNYDPYQFPMASQSAANLATEFSGAEIVPPEAVSPEVQRQGANRQAIIGMIPTGPEDALGAIAKMGVLHNVPNLFMNPAMQDAIRGVEPDDIWRNWQWEKNPAGQWWTETSGKPTLRTDVVKSPAGDVNVPRTSDYPADQSAYADPDQLKLFDSEDIPTKVIPARGGVIPMKADTAPFDPRFWVKHPWRPGTVSDFVDNPSLYEQPGLEFLGGLPMNLRDYPLPLEPDAGGFFSPPSSGAPKGRIEVKAGKSAVPITQHELTHAAAKEFGLPQGFNPRSASAASQGYGVRQNIAGDMAAYEDAFNKRTADYWKHQDEMFDKYGDLKPTDFDEAGNVVYRPGEMTLKEFKADWAKKNPMMQDVLNQHQDVLGDLTGMTDEMLAYHTSMGEVSARNAQRRDTGWYTPEGLRNKRPEKTEDVPRKYQWTNQTLNPFENE